MKWMTLVVASPEIAVAVRTFAIALQTPKHSGNVFGTIAGGRFN